MLTIIGGAKRSLRCWVETISHRVSYAVWKIQIVDLMDVDVVLLCG